MSDYKTKYFENYIKKHGKLPQGFEHLNPGGAQAPGASTAAAPDYFQLVKEEKTRRKCTTAEAAAAVRKKHPASWLAMLSAANGGEDFSHKLERRRA
jgi:ATP-dependent DNA ligase